MALEMISVTEELNFKFYLILTHLHCHRRPVVTVLNSANLHYLGKKGIKSPICIILDKVLIYTLSQFSSCEVRVCLPLLCS